MIAVLLFLFCARFGNSETRTVISYVTPDLTTNVNETINLKCRVDNVGSKALAWFKRDKNNESLVIATNDFILVSPDDGPVRYQAKKEGGTYTLTINSVNDEDTGEYKCSIPFNTSYSLSKSIKVTVRTPPSFLENTTANLILRENSAGNLECYPAGTPPLKILWTRENDGILPTGSKIDNKNVIHMSNVLKEYAGIYYCTVNNGFQSAKKAYRLQVEFEPEIQVSKKRVGQALQNKSELECKIAAFPEPRIVWVKDNKIIDMEPNVRISKSALPDSITISKLEITVVNRTQYGNYTCKAENVYGKTQETIEFFETAEVQCPTATCGAKFDYPEFTLIFSTTSMLVLLMFRW